MWVAADFSRSFQLMRCDDLRLIQPWVLEWRGLGVTFEIIPLVKSVRRGRSSTPIHGARPA
jgi:Protein of unknown function (DUF3303)